VAEEYEGSAAAVGPTLGRLTPILRVADLDASVAYYVERLGFRLQWRADPVASVGRDEATLMLCMGDQGQAGAWVWGTTSDADVLYAEFETRGAQLRHPPTNYPWGSRECQVSDPDGHVLRFGADLLPGAPMGAWLDGDGRRWVPTSDGGWLLAE
jgi:catechol 2,3-dioxygenase-like lactoylglutathione lyase family enzyme